MGDGLGTPGAAGMGLEIYTALKREDNFGSAHITCGCFVSWCPPHVECFQEVQPCTSRDRKVLALEPRNFAGVANLFWTI